MLYSLWQRANKRRNLGTIFAKRSCLGRCKLIEDEDRAMKVLKDFAMKYYPSVSMVEAEMKKVAKATQMFEITIEHISGKEVQER